MQRLRRRRRDDVARAPEVATDALHTRRAVFAELTARHRESGDPELAREIVRLRHQAVGDVPREPASNWPGEYRDPFPDVVGRPPEITADELSTEVLGGAVLHHGCLLVRNLFSQERVAQLRGDIDRAFSARDTVDGRNGGWYAPFEPEDDTNSLAARRKWVEDCGAMWAADSPPALVDILDALGDVGVPDVIGGYLGEPPLLSVNKCTLRRVSPETFPSWHQDGAFLGEEVRTIDVWVSFTDCGAGTNAPGLSIVPRRVDHLLPRGTGGALVRDAIGHEEVLRTLDGEQPCTPHFAAGDALLFDGLFVHCTGAQPGQTDVREALEAWFFTPSTFPQGYVALAI